MKVGFFHDHVFIRSGRDIRTSGTLDSNLWSRYRLKDVESITVCARVKDGVENSAPLASCDGVEFKFTPSISSVTSLLFSFNHSVIKSVVSNIDIVVARLPSEVGLAAMRYAKKSGKKCIVELVACPYDALSFHGSLLGKWYAPVMSYRTKLAVAKADGVLYVTEKFLQSRYPSKQKTVSASNVIIKEVGGVDAKTRFSRFLERLEKRELQIGLIGNLENRLKGLEVAIKACKGLPITLNVVGRGDPEKYQKVADHFGVQVVFHGFVSSEKQKFHLLDDIDIYVQPSLQEGLPRATIEAMSRGCPVLSSDAGGLVELVDPRFVHKSGDVGGLASHLKSLLSSKDGQIQELCKHSLIVSKRYLRDSVDSKRKKFYEGVMF